MNDIKTIEEYLKALNTALRDQDKALRRDALADAEDHLRSALREAREDEPEGSDETLLAGIIHDYGFPEETADAYRELERRLSPGKNRSDVFRERSVFLRFTGVIGDSRAWGALLYSLLALPMGIIYFSWVATGLSLSLSLIILIFGLPLAVLFFLSFHGLAFIEGRLVETLLGIRMPRRRIFIDSARSWSVRMKRLFFRGDSWLIILYLLLSMPLGILYFTLNITVLATGLGLVASPIVMGILHEPFIVTTSTEIWHNGWTTAGCIVLGTVLFLAGLHMAKGLGWLQGHLARAMLIRERD
jgi:hypothetical protein